MSEATKKANGAGKKRRYQKPYQQNPKRGGPGVLMTCETGREVKCQREGLDILNHYCHSSTTVTKKDNETASSLNLEEELKMLRSRKTANASSLFGVYDTGCRGSVFAMCTKPGCNLIPAIKVDSTDKSSRQEGSSEKTEEDGDECATKKPRIDGTTSEEAHNSADRKEDSQLELSQEEGNPWDPVETVRKIITDIERNSTSAPGSRFVTRMIPMQATCFASAEEIRLTSRALLTKLFAPNAFKTFAISTKRRICSNVTRKEIIDTVAEIVLELNPKCKVDLDNPEATITVEICRTLCGISVVPKSHEFHNFSLVTAREATSAAEKKSKS